VLAFLLENFTEAQTSTSRVQTRDNLAALTYSRGKATRLDSRFWWTWPFGYVLPRQIKLSRCLNFSETKYTGIPRMPSKMQAARLVFGFNICRLTQKSNGLTQSFNDQYGGFVYIFSSSQL
jgi:hypothetical protein